ncbi:MAG: hypothetical protein QHJ73_10520, partial [Armatimonadota bacterium]|nr:hypothetical protein [Armatimonadota bacterium]
MSSLGRASTCLFLFLTLVARGAGARAADLSYVLLHGGPVAGSTGVLYAATFHPEAVPPSAWDDRLAKIRRGGFGALHVVLPSRFGPDGPFTPLALEDLLGRASKTGLRLAVGPPVGDLPDDWPARLEAAKPVLAKQQTGLVWVQPGGDVPAGIAALTPGGQPLLVVNASAARVPNAPDELRPFRQPAVAVALREAAAEGSGFVAWG